MRTKSSTRIVMTIIMKTVPLMMTTPFDQVLSATILSFGQMGRQSV